MRAPSSRHSSYQPIETRSCLDLRDGRFGLKPSAERRLSDTSQYKETPKFPRRNILAERQRTCLFDLPTDEATLLKHCTLAENDIERVHGRGWSESQLGFALQLCASRFPGRLPQSPRAFPTTRMAEPSSRSSLSSSQSLLDKCLLVS